MKARYIRISSKDQNNARQLAKAYPDEKLYIDIISGSVPFNQRPSAKELLADLLILGINQISVSSIDRLGRSAFNVQETIDFLTRKNVCIIVDNLGLSSIVNGKPNPIFKLISDVLANVASMEKDAIKERQAEGIKIAKELGKFSGKRNKSSASDEDVLVKYKNVLKELKQGKNSLRDIAKLCDVSLGTVQKVQAAFKRTSEKV